MGCFSIAAFMGTVMVGQELGLTDMLKESIPKVFAMVLADMFSLGIGLLLVI